jgi:hypothetical protein
MAYRLVQKRILIGFDDTHCWIIEMLRDPFGGDQHFGMGVCRRGGRRAWGNTCRCVCHGNPSSEQSLIVTPSAFPPDDPDDTETNDLSETAFHGAAFHIVHIS